MSTAALYDIHGNLPALEAVLEEIKVLNVDQIVVGGDVVVGPMSRECLDTLCQIQIPVHFIRGNCETAVLNEMDGNSSETLPDRVLEDIRWTAKQLLVEHQHILDSWPMTFELDIAGLGNVLFCHATPRNDDEIFTRMTPEEKLAPIFAEVDAAVVVCGHTHMQFDRHVGPTRVVNAGSVGMPFGKAGAHWLLLGPDIEFCLTTYDYEMVADRIRRTAYPNASHFAENSVLSPPLEKTMLRIFDKAELSA